MADGLYVTYGVALFSANYRGSISDVIALDRSSDPYKKGYLILPSTTPSGESWTATYSLAASAVVNLDLTALPYTFGASTFNKVFNGIFVVQFQSYDPPGAGNSISIVSGTNGFVGPWGSSGVSLALGGDIFCVNPGDFWTVDSTHKLLTITAPAVAVNFGIHFAGSHS